MKQLISFKQAVNLSLSLYCLLILFHLSVIIGMLSFNYVPIDFLWGGRMNSREQLLNFEIISLVVVLVFFLAVLIRSERVLLPSFISISRILLWLMFITFTMNSIGNLLARSTFEKYFAIPTIILAILSLRLALEPLTKAE